MYRQQRVAVVIPAHNEARLIERTLRSIPPFVDAIFVVDDASTDSTLAHIRSAAASDPRVVPLAHADNRGVGAAIVTGYRAALAAGADAVAVMDGDGQMDPRDLPALLDAVILGRADFAKGNRFDGLVPRGWMPPIRIVGNLTLSAATRLVGGFASAIDAHCGFTALSAEAIARLPLDELYPRYGFPNDLAIRSREAGLRIAMVPVRSVYGSEVSGIRAHVAIPRIVALLARAAFRRLRTALPAIADARAEAAERP